MRHRRKGDTSRVGRGGVRRAVAVWAVAIWAPIAGPPASLEATQSITEMTPERWRSDVDTMTAHMRSKHADLFHDLAPFRFDSAVSKLREDVASLTSHEILVEVARLAALVGDGHTRFWLNRPSDTGFGQVAARVYRFSDGWYVRAVDSRHSWAAGRRILGIGGRAIDDVLEQVAELIGKDNSQTGLAIAADYLVIPEVLHALGIIATADTVTYRIAGGDGEAETTLSLPRISAEALEGVNVSRGPPGNPVDPQPVGDNVTLVSAQTAEEAPLWLRESGGSLLAQHLPARDAFYVRVTRIADTDEIGFVQFLEETFDEAVNLGVERYVLDLRRAWGGNNQLALPAVLALVRRQLLDQPGRVWVLIGRHTFSATMTLVTQLERMTHATFVGEPTGGRPNYYADARPARLPNAGLVVGVSSLYWQDSDPDDDRPWISPHLPVGLSSQDYRAGSDPVLETALEASATARD